jgi:hypothetical protein
MWPVLVFDRLKEESEMAPRIPVEVLDNDSFEMRSFSRMGTPARIQSQVAVNRIGAITRLTTNAAQGLASVYGSTAEQTEAGIRRLDRQDALMARLGDEAAREHEIAKENLRRRQQQIAEAASEALRDLFQRDLEDTLCQPDGAFYTLTARERFGAWFRDEPSLELQRRNLAPLTPGEKVKEFFLGGVTDARVAAHDRKQIAERRDRLDLGKQLAIAQTQLQELAAQNADLEFLVGEERAPASAPLDDDDAAAQIDAVEALLRQVRTQRQATEPVLGRRMRANGRTEVVDAEFVE